MTVGDLATPDLPADTVGYEFRCTRRGRRRSVAAGALALVAALAWWGARPATPRPPPPATSAAAPTLHDLTGLDDPVVVAVSPVAGPCCELLRWAPDAATPERVGTVDVRDPAFDRTGRWVAGLRPDPLTGGGAVLWLGPVPGDIQPVSAQVDGFAWHDRHPAALAWSRTVADRGELAVLLPGPAPSRWATDAPAGRVLRAWGSWGFALGAADSSDTTIADLRGSVVLERHPGFVAGRAPGLGWLTTRLDSPPGPVSVLDDVDDPTRPLAAGRFAELASSVAVSPDGRHTAVHLARGRPGAPLDGARVVVLDHAGRSRHQMTDVPTGTGLSWTADAERLVAARAGSDGSVELAVWHHPSGAVRVAAVPGLDIDRSVVAALAVQHPDPAGLAPPEGRP